MFNIFNSNAVIEIQDAIGNIGRIFRRRRNVPAEIDRLMAECTTDDRGMVESMLNEVQHARVVDGVFRIIDEEEIWNRKK